MLVEPVVTRSAHSQIELTESRNASNFYVKMVWKVMLVQSLLVGLVNARFKSSQLCYTDSGSAPFCEGTVYLKVIGGERVSVTMRLSVGIWSECVRRDLCLVKLHVANLVYHSTCGNKTAHSLTITQAYCNDQNSGGTLYGMLCDKICVCVCILRGPCCEYVCPTRLAEVVVIVR